MKNEQQLIKSLRQELLLQTRHRQLLEAQGSALLACDRPRFCDLQNDYVALLALLQAHQDERQKLMQDGDGKPCSLSPLLDQVSARGRRSLEALREDLGRTLSSIREQSDRNQMLIQNELKYIAFLLDLFVEAGRSAEANYGGVMRRRLLLDRRA
jgi:hypothetical protein